MHFTCHILTQQHCFL